MAPEIPIYCSEITKKLLTIISDLSDDDFLRYSYHVKEKRSGGYFPGSLYKKKKYRERKINIINPNDIIEIPEERGIFRVKGYLVDHSVPGAMAFEVIIKKGKKILYTGDIRFHGHEHEKSNSMNYFLIIMKL